MSKYNIPVTCPDCCETFHRRKRSIQDAIKNSGVWRCLPCAQAHRQEIHGSFKGPLYPTHLDARPLDECLGTRSYT